MPSYLTPGVYVEEISTLPPSVAEVATAIPAFIGYTAKGKPDEVEIAQVSTLLEYEERFGKAAPTAFTVTVTTGDEKTPAAIAIAATETGDPKVFPLPQSMLWYALDIYFKNGGGRCYVVSIGKDPDRADVGRFLTGLDALKVCDEPTLIVTPQSAFLPETDRNTLAQAALTHCHELGDRFAILDAYPNHSSKPETFDGFRGGVTNCLNYGAAYYPHVDTSLTHFYDETSVTVITDAVIAKGDRRIVDAMVKVIKGAMAAALEATASLTAGAHKQAVSAVTNDNTIIGAIKGKVSSGDPAEMFNAGMAAAAKILSQACSAAKMEGAVAPTYPTVVANCLRDIMIEAIETADDPGITWATCATAKTAVVPNDVITQITTAFSSGDLAAAKSKALEFITDQQLKTLVGKKLDALALPKPLAGATVAVTLDKKKEADTALYNRIKQALAEQRVRLPPSPAIAGVYARVDRERGVWKAPANVGLVSVNGPAVQITNAEQDRLNIDPTSGKSINAIRSFAGRGTLVWGARTLAGNDNEWRYVPVRRLFILIEESLKKASAFAVFEPNDATTWLKVRGMIDSYLYGLWQQGALQGAEPKAAYYVHVGLGTTMTAQDILEGRMIVEVGLAAVRPAEFIVLRFSHLLATS